MFFDFNRSFLSYSKVQQLTGFAVRNKRFQLWRTGVRSKSYLDIGCGRNTHAHMINLDWQWHPGIDLCWDVAKLGLPLPDHSLRGIYSEHCLEHHQPRTALSLLSECLRILRPGGRIRLVLPDAEKYLRIYGEAIAGAACRPFPYSSDVYFDGIESPLLAVNRIFYQDRDSPHGHCFMYDSSLLTAFLDKVGFVDIRRSDFSQGDDSLLLLDSEERWIESFAIEARKPEF